MGYVIAAPVGVGEFWKRMRDLYLISSRTCSLQLLGTYSEVTQTSTSLMRVSSPSVVVLNLANTGSSCNCEAGAESVTPE